MNFTPELQFEGADFRGRVRSLSDDDQANLLNLYQHPELPGQRPLDPASEAAQEHIARMIELSVQMAATQRGMMWALEINDEFQGMVSVFDWQPSQLRATLRVDGLAALTLAQRASALTVCMDFLSEKYHMRNFAYQWIAGQNQALLDTLEGIGFEPCATLRDGWKLITDNGEKTYVDVVQLHRVVNLQAGGES